LKWKSVNYANGYNVQVSNDSDFISNRLDDITADTVHQLINIEHSDSYYWRVRALTAIDTSDWSEVRTFETINLSPVLVSPYNMESDVPVNGFINWLAMPLAVSYDFEIALDSLFEQIVTSDISITENYYFYTDLEYSTEYFWRVKAVFADDTSDWSSTWSFTTLKESLINAPFLISPENNSEENDENGTLIWSKIEDASYYELNVSKTSNFDSLVVEEFFLTDTTFAYSDFKPDSTYFWRVKAFLSVDSSNWSATWSFRIEPEIELGLVHLVHPSNESIMIPTESEFSWRSKEYAVKYQLQITKFDFHEDSILVNDYTTDTIYVYSELQKNEKYFWRVRYFTEKDTSKWTTPWIFTTEPYYILDTPELSYPIDSAKVVPVDIQFQWNRIEGKVKCLLELSQYPDFYPQKDVFHDIKDDFLEYSQLQYNTQYYWQIMAYNDSSYSQWSDVEVFLTELQSPTVIYPDSTVIEVKVKGSIEWDSVKGADWYVFELAKDELFSEVIISESKYKMLSYNYDLEELTEYFYRIKAKSDNNESRWRQGSIKTEKITDVFEEITQNNEFLIYPNPAKNELFLNLLNPEVRNISISIVNSLGYPIFQKDITLDGHEDHLMKIDVSSINSGVYHVVCEYGTQMLVRKLIIIK